MEITAYPRRVTLDDDTVFLTDGQDGTKIITAHDLANHLGQFVPVEQTVWNGELTTTWSGSGPWTQNVTLTGIKSTDQPFVQLNYDPPNEALKKDMAKQWNCIDKVETANNRLTFTCKFKKPTKAIPFVVVKGGSTNG